MGDVAVVLGVLIPIHYYRRKGSAGGFSLVYAGENIGDILFKAHGAGAVGFRGSARHEFPYFVEVYLLAGRQVVQYNSNAFSVAFAENGNGDTALKQ